MSSDEAKFGVKLTDDVSGSSRVIDRNVDELIKSMRQLDASVGKLDRSMDRLEREFKDVDRDLKKLPSSAARADRAIDGLERSSRGSAGAMGSMGSMASTAKYALLGLAAAGAYTAFQLGKGAVSAVKFRDESLTGLTLIQGSADKANKTFGDSVELADELGTSWQTTVGGMQKLLGKGFGVDEATDLTKAVSDLSVVAPDANIDNLLLAIGQIKTAGKLQGDELNQLTEAGLNADLMFKNLEKSLGKSRDEIMKMKEQGKLLAGPVLGAIKDSVQDLTGKELGKASEDASKTTAGFLRRLEQLPERFFLGVTDAIDKSGLDKTLEKLWENLGPESAGFNAAVEGLATAFDLTTQSVNALLPAAKEFFGGFSEGFEALDGKDPFEVWKDPENLAAVRKFGKDIGTIADVAASLASSIDDVALALAKMSQFFQGETGITKSGSDLGQSLRGSIRDMVPESMKFLWDDRSEPNEGQKFLQMQEEQQKKRREEGFSVGKALGDGMVAGIDASLIGIDAAAARAGNTAIASVRRETDTHSPSREAFDVGSDFGVGMSLGIKDSLPNVFDAANDMGATALRSTSSRLPPVQRGSAVNNTTSTRVGDISVTVVAEGSGGGASPQDIAMAVRRELERVFDGVATSGAA